MPLLRRLGIISAERGKNQSVASPGLIYDLSACQVGSRRNTPFNSAADASNLVQ
jgi:hypothetical protein